MPPKYKMATKTCHSCDIQVPVASKTCQCGYKFFTQKRTEFGILRKSSECKDGDSDSKTEKAPEEENKPRRTERTKRLRPDFYNSIEIDNRTRTRRTKSASESLDSPHRRRQNILNHRSRAAKVHKTPSLLSSRKQGTKSDDDQDGQDDQSNGEEFSFRRKRGRPRRERNGADQEEAVYDKLSSDQLFQCSQVLANINRKFLSVRPIS